MRKRDVPVTRARAKDAEKLERDRRVGVVVERMSHGAWDTKVARELASAWACSIETVRDYAREANSVIRLAFTPEQKEALRSQVLLGSERCYREAIERRRHLPGGADVPDPDVKGAVGALRLLADVHGLIVTKSEVNLSSDRAEFEAMAPAEQARKLREMVKAMSEHAEALERQHTDPAASAPSDE